MEDMKKKLEITRDNLLERLNSAKEQKSRGLNGVVAEDDIAQLLQEEDIIDSLSDKEIKLLKQVENALSRIHTGVYGICLSCEECISKKRLNAVPYTLYCEECIEEFENN